MKEFDYNKSEQHEDIKQPTPSVTPKEASSGLKLKSAPAVSQPPTENLYAPPVTEAKDLEVKYDSDYTLASPWIRLGAHFLEGLVVSVFVVPLAIIAAIVIPTLENKGGNSETSTVVAGVLVLVIAIISLIYVSINIYFLVTKGQTIGKKLMNIRIVRAETTTKASFWRICCLRSFVPGLIGQIPLVGPFFSLLDPLFIFSSNRQCLHDKIADTAVINC